MDPGGHRQYLLLADILSASLASEPNPGARAVEAGRAWGGTIVATPSDDQSTAQARGSGRELQQLMTVLDHLGFEPEHRRGSGGDSIGLRHCPFLELAESRAQIVCPIHLGLMRGVMEASHSSLTVGRLDAFVEPDLCVAHLSSAGNP
jgi:predicted ArsR family transcriptional regulator